jgi:hypothetical protein
MYFPTSNHYFDNLDELTNYSLTYDIHIDNDKGYDIGIFEHIIENNECLICLEINDNSDNICIKIQNMFYNKDCLCDGWVHHYCLDIWFIKNNKCPICLCRMIKNEINEINDKEVTTNENEMQIENTNKLVFLRIVNNLNLIVKYLLLVSFLYNFIFILSNIIKLIRDY